ncbi:MAG: hypothetical protein ACTSPX_01250 [Candidatus Thorarchaeota archaeon]
MAVIPFHDFAAVVASATSGQEIVSDKLTYADVMDIHRVSVYDVDNTVDEVFLFVQVGEQRYILSVSSGSLNRHGFSVRFASIVPRGARVGAIVNGATAGDDLQLAISGSYEA